ncbi:GntR family transcriptional regulator [Tropicimonas sp. IMCC34011]|uniref:GntR family transcriptional regulator n=1 Tax=Tropicimonas sp. IMCC34011 TaxID=2248759 RepID=UPI000E251FD4|nr:GntR family transcriptional regulator [Tropicimonas sp. IMCC34011]
MSSPSAPLRGKAGPPGTSSVRTAGYQRFLDALRTGELKPGQMVSQKALSENLDLSVGTLRELLPRLESEGLIKVLNQRGILIPAIDLTMIRETFQLRMALEREAAAQAADDMPQEALDAHRASHEAMMVAMRECPTEATLAEAEEIDAAFHDALMDATGNALLIRTYEMNTTRMRLIKLYRHALSAAYMLDAFTDHLAIIDAIGSRDRAAAMAAMESHIQSARSRAVHL